MKEELEKIIKREEDNVRGIHIFSNKNRREIFRELTKFPCRTSSSLSKILGIDVRSVEWHLKKLESLEYVISLKKNKKYYCIKDLVREEDLPFFTLLGKAGIRNIIKNVINGCKEINSFEIKRATLYRYLSELKTLKIISVIGTKRKMLCPTNKLEGIMEKYDEIGREYKRIILKKLDMKGYEIEVIGTVNYELKIRISGVEDFNMGIFISPLRTILEV